MRIAVIALTIVATVPGLVHGANPTPFALPPGGEPVGGGRDICWHQFGDENQPIGSSEVIGEYGVVTEIANDFLFSGEFNLGMARWWGGYWNGEPQNFRMNLRFYGSRSTGPGEAGLGNGPRGAWGMSGSHIPCTPVMVLHEWLDVDCHQMPVGAVFSYSFYAELHFAAETTYWFSAQAADHPFPPQWGRLGTSEPRECETVFRSAYFAYPDWTLASDVFGSFFEASQVFECGDPTEGSVTTWGGVRALYR